MGHEAVAELCQAAVGNAASAVVRGTSTIALRCAATHHPAFAMLRLLALSCLLFNAIDCHAEEVRISCLFDRSLDVLEMDAEAKDLRFGFQANNSERVILLDLKPPKMLNGDTRIRLFPDGPSRVMVDHDEISVIWRADKHPRTPVMSLSVNRFSLEAVEYFQISKLGGRDVFSWTRSGKCKVDSRKF